MKLNKKQVGLIAGVVCVILLTILLLTMCNGGSPETSVATTAASETTVVTTEAVEETTEPSTEETTEETTEATEETTEATEATKPVTGGNNGSSTGSNTTVTQPTVPETIPDAGSEGSPYYEMVGELPLDTQLEIDTVAIPVKNTVHYNLDTAEASILTIENAPDAYIIYQEKEYKADENGVVSLTLAAAQEDAPVLVQIGNNDAEERTFSLKFSHAVGAKENPHILEDEEAVADGKWTKELAVSLAAGNAKGYHYQYTAAEKGTLSLSVKSVTGKDDGQTDVEPVAETDSKLCEIVVSVGEATYKLSESSTDSVSADMNAGDVAMIQIVAIAAEDGTYPALEALVDCVFTYPQGTEKNPICVSELTSVEIQNLAVNEKRYYYAEDIEGAILKIENSYAYIQIGEKKVEAIDGRVQITIDTSERVDFVVGHNASVARNLKMEISHAIGSKLNPKILTTSTRKVTQRNITKDYYFVHNAVDGIITFEILTADSANWKYEIKNLNTGECSGVCSSTDETVKNIFTLGANNGDVIQVVFGTCNDQEATIKYVFNRTDKDASVVSETLLQSGENVLKPVSTAKTTVFKFTPGEIGTYIFETDAGATLSYWGSSVEEMANVTTEESNALTYTVTAEDETVLIGVTGANSCNLNIIKSIVYSQEEIPAVYTMKLQEDQQFVSVDLTQKQELFIDEESGVYSLGKDGPVVLVDLASDTFVNLKKYMETKELYCRVTDENGEAIQENYNTLLEKYISSAVVVQISETESKTLYPLTEELMHILMNAGAQLGWYDSTSTGYLFGAVADAETESLWMFSCCTVQTDVVAAANPDEEPGEKPDEEPGDKSGEESGNEPGEELGEEPTAE